MIHKMIIIGMILWAMATGLIGLYGELIVISTIEEERHRSRKRRKR